jgi:hypothetical protein
MTLKSIVVFAAGSLTSIVVESLAVWGAFDVLATRNSTRAEYFPAARYRWVAEGFACQPVADLSPKSNRYLVFGDRALTRAVNVTGLADSTDAGLAESLTPTVTGLGGPATLIDSRALPPACLIDPFETTPMST